MQNCGHIEPGSKNIIKNALISNSLKANTIYQVDLQIITIAYCCPGSEAVKI